MLKNEIQKQFGHHFKRYLSYRRVAQICESTLENEAQAHGYFWTFLKEQGFQGDELSVSREDMLGYASYLNQNKAFKANTKHHRFKMLSPFYKECLRQGWMNENPLRQIPNPKREQTAPFVLSIPQMKALLSLPSLDSVMGIRDRLLMELLYSTALRKGELASLRVGDFSEDYRQLKIKGKGHKEAVIFVGKLAAHFVRFYIEVLRPHLKSDGGELVFYSLKTGRPLPPRWIEQIVIRYGRRLGLKERLTPHVFRYSIATHLSESGMDLYLIQQYLRHENIETTSRYIRQDFQRLQETHRRTHPREL